MSNFGADTPGGRCETSSQSITGYVYTCVHIWVLDYVHTMFILVCVSHIHIHMHTVLDTSIQLCTHIYLCLHYRCRYLMLALNVSGTVFQDSVHHRETLYELLCCVLLVRSSAFTHLPMALPAHVALHSYSLQNWVENMEQMDDYLVLLLLLIADQWVCSGVCTLWDVGWNLASIFWHMEDGWLWGLITIHSAHMVQIWWMPVLSWYAL